jgi:glycosyltransferase involved in cell wall biosynthesis
MKGKRRICLNAMLLPENLGGIGNYTYHILRHLVPGNPDWEFTLLINAAAAPAFRAIPGLRIREVTLSSRPARLAFLHLVFPFQAGGYDLVHSVGNMGMAMCPAPQVITIHDTYECVSPERFTRRKRLLMRLLVAASGFAARRILTDSHNSGKDIARFYPHLASKVAVVQLGNKYPVRDAVEPDGREGFLFVGTVEPGKNLALVLKAFARFRKAHGGTLKVVGAKGWKQTRLPELMESLGISAHVEFMGYIPDESLPELYRGVLALVQASNYEGFGLPVIEAMANGCPVISARNSALIEAGGDSALFFETGDEDGLYRRMAQVHADAEVRRTCIRTGYAHARKFTWESTAEGTRAGYLEAMG